MYWVQILHPVLFQAAPRSVVNCTPLRHLHPVLYGVQDLHPAIVEGRKRPGGETAVLKLTGEWPTSSMIPRQAARP